MKTSIQLIKQSDAENEKDLFWSAEVDGNVITYRWGQQDGKEQIKTQTILEGKNIGKKNATSKEEQAVLEAATKARHKIERGYRISNDYVLPVNEKTVLKQASDAPKPMLAFPVEKLKYVKQPDGAYKKIVEKDFWNKVIYPCHTQPKLDGIRALIKTDGSVILSRSLKPIFGMDHILDEIKSINWPDNIEWLDGELYSHKIDFQKIMSITRTRKNLKSENELREINFYLFDVISNKTFQERFIDDLDSVMEDLLDLLYTVVVPTTICNSRQDIESAHNLYMLDEYEGTMIRNNNMGYENKRSYSLFKYKDFVQEEFKVVNFNKEKGKHPEEEDTLGSIDIVTNKGAVCSARLKMSHDSMKEVWLNREHYLNKIATVEFQGYTDSDPPKLRFPRVIGFRDADDL